MNYLKIDTCDIANGNHVGVVLWVAGCDLHCPGCHNPESWDFDAGKPFDNNAREKLFNLLDKPFVKRFTISGGHPLAPQNIKSTEELIADIGRFYPSIEIWLYTGYDLKVENFIDENDKMFRTLYCCDYVIDGPYIDNLRDITLPFRGSPNQRIIDVAKTTVYGRIITSDEKGI